MYLTRHSDLIKEVDLNTQIVIAGAGSIGSYSALALSKLGFKNLVIFDNGKVEEENIAPQFFRQRDIGKFKVNCLAESLRQHSGVEIIAIPEKLAENTASLVDKSPSRVLILAVDTMLARKSIASFMATTFCVDSRMAIEFLTIISYYNNYDGQQFYKSTLFNDADAVQENCTNKAISYTSLIAGGLVSKTVLNLLTTGNEYSPTTLNFDINTFDMLRL